MKKITLFIYESIKSDIDFWKYFETMKNGSKHSINNKELMDMFGLERLELYTDDRISRPGKYIELNTIVAKDKKQGAGTKFMNALTQWADAESITLMTTPDIFMGSTSKSRLKNFFKRFGFKENNGRNYNPETLNAMLRKPNA